MSVSPMVVGQTLPALSVSLYQDGAIEGQPGNEYLLTGITASQFSVNMYDTGTKTDLVGAGTFFIPVSTGNIVQYQWNSADTATAGNKQVFISITISGNVLTFDPIPIVIVPK